MLIYRGHSMLHPEYLDLLDYLGTDFDLNWATSGDKKIEEERLRYASEEEFNRNTMIFCYQSVGLSCAGMHRPYIAELLKRTAGKFGVTVIDVGAGGGQDGLSLNSLGYFVSFADIHSKSMNFLEWRMRRRNLNLALYCLEALEQPIPMHDYALCFDVLEHFDDAGRFELLKQLAGLGGTVITNLIHGDGHDIPGVHHTMDLEAVTRFVQETWPGAYYEDFYPDENGHCRQRMLVYGTQL